jgi:hypothetical protein
MPRQAALGDIFELFRLADMYDCPEIASIEEAHAARTSKTYGEALLVAESLIRSRLAEDLTVFHFNTLYPVHAHDISYLILVRHPPHEWQTELLRLRIRSGVGGGVLWLEEYTGVAQRCHSGGWGHGEFTLV